MLNKVRDKIESIMHRPERGDATPSESILSGLSSVYGGILRTREILYQQRIKSVMRLPCFVISVGNITVGGTGKTPMVIYIAELIRKSGLRVAIVSRGYGGKASSKGGIVSDGKSLLMDAEKAGDEPFMMAKRLLLNGVPVFIGSNRYKAGMAAVEAFSPDVIILDDGFQHLKLDRDLNILLCDAESPAGNGRVIPRGTLREPAAAVKRADMVVLTRSLPENRLGDIGKYHNALPCTDSDKTPVFTCYHRPFVMGVKKEGISRLIPFDNRDYKKVFAFSAIAKNYDFRNTVKESGFTIAGFEEFYDHHPYSESDCRNLAGAARKLGAEALITTEKDFAKLKGIRGIDLPLIVIGVDMEFGDEKSRFNGAVLADIKQE